MKTPPRLQAELLKSQPWRPLAAALGLAFAAFALPSQAAVMISQVYGGGGNTGATYNYDYVELHNDGPAAVNLAGLSLQYASAAGAAAASTTSLSGTIPAGGYFLVRLGTSNAAVGAALPVTPDLIGNSSTNLSGSAGKLALVNGTAALTAFCPAVSANTVDFLGYGSTASCFETGAAPAPSNTTALFRNNAGATTCLDTGNNSTDFAAAAPLPRNAASAAQACLPGGSTGGGGVAVEKRIFEIQGSGTRSALAGQNVFTTGVITKVNNNGFFLQDQQGDGNPLTSDGIFVFTGTAAYSSVAVGNLVKVTGTVIEFNTGATGNADTEAHTLTQLSTVTAVDFLNGGQTITPTVVTLPEAANDDLERYEGMLVTLVGPLTVNQNFFQGRYGQLTLSSGGRLETPTNRFRAGTPEALALANENARRRILLDDGSSLQNPDPIPYLGSGIRRAGDTVASITGVIDYGLATNSNTGAGDYKIHPSVTPVFTLGNVRTPAPEAVGGNLKVASFNVLNYFTAFVDGTGSANGCTLGTSTSTGNCRGANNQAEFTRQQTKIVKAMVALNADVLGLMEIQNNANVAAQNLVNALNAEVGAGTYVTTALPAATGTDAIRVAIIYKAAAVAPIGSPVGDADPINNRPTLAQTFALANGERFTLFVNHMKSKGSCPAASDADFTGNNDVGDGQGCWNALRTQQATRLRSFVNTQLAANSSSNALLIGDFNAYGKEDPIVELTNNGYLDQVSRFSNFGYSYVFDGAAGRLDHAIANAALSGKVNSVAHWHVNADEPVIIDYNSEFKRPAGTPATSTTCTSTVVTGCPADPYTPTPYRSSDHDPVVIGLNLYNTVVNGNGTRAPLQGTAGDDLFVGGAGGQVMTGAGGKNGYVYRSLADAGDTITDFRPGFDRIDLSALLASIKSSSNTAIAQNVVHLVALGSDTLVQIAPEATTAAPRSAARTLVVLKNVSPAAIDPLRDMGLQMPAVALRGTRAAARQ